MPCLNSSGAEQTIKNKHVKGVLKHSKQFERSASPESARENTIAMFLWVLCGFGLITPAIGQELQESVTVNRPVIRSYPGTQSRVHFSAGSIRCFCNLPQCVSTGYMCKSSEGGCFSDVLDHLHPRSNAYRGRHGCLELLSRNKEEKSWCQNGQRDAEKPRRKGLAKSQLLCCYHDMCNHADSPETRILLNSTMLDEISNDGRSRFLETVVRQQENSYTTSDVWLKAATIAVPICGAVILFVLVALAVKILRAESHNSTNYKLRQAYYHPNTQRNKNALDKISPLHYNCNYENILCNQIMMAHQATHNQNEDPRKYVHMPLLQQNVINCVEKEKDEFSATVSMLEESECMLLPNVHKNANIRVNICDVNSSDSEQYVSKK